MTILFIEREQLLRLFQSSSIKVPSICNENLFTSKDRLLVTICDLLPLQILACRGGFCRATSKSHDLLQQFLLSYSIARTLVPDVYSPIIGLNNQSTCKTNPQPHSLYSKKHRANSTWKIIHMMKIIHNHTTIAIRSIIKEHKRYSFIDHLDSVAFLRRIHQRFHLLLKRLQRDMTCADSSLAFPSLLLDTSTRVVAWKALLQTRSKLWLRVSCLVLSHVHSSQTHVQRYLRFSLNGLDRACDSI